MDNQIVEAKMAFASQQVLAEYVKKELELGLIDADAFLEKATIDCKEAIPQGTAQANMISKLIFIAKETESIEKLALLLVQIRHYFNESLNVQAKDYLAASRVRLSNNGKESKVRWWAAEAGKVLMQQHPKATKAQLFKLIPDSLDPMNIAAAGQRWEIYKDGDKVIAIKDCDGTSQELQESTFKKTYLKKGD